MKKLLLFLLLFGCNDDIINPLYVKDNQLVQRSSVEVPFIWIDKDIHPPTRYYNSSDYHRRVYGNLDIIDLIGNGSGNNNFIILIDDYLYGHSEIQNVISRWAQDAINDNGFNLISIVQCNECTENQIRELFVNQYNNNNLVGAFLIGDIPMTWIDDPDGPFGAAQYPTSYRYTVFGCDLTDVSGDGIYDEDTCTCDFGQCWQTTSDIYVGWLKTRGCNNHNIPNQDCLDWSLGGYSNEVDAVINYFDRNHQNRNTISNNDNLLFVDDIFQNNFSIDEYDYYSNLSGGTSMINRYDLSENTNKEDFIIQMNKQRMVSFSSSHSSYFGQFFSCDCNSCNYDWPGPDNCYQNFYYTDLLDLNQTPLFHIWEGCSIGRFIEVNNMANWHIFHPNGGVAGIGSAENISPMDFNHLLNPMSENKNIGESMKNWFDNQLRYYGGYRYYWEVLGDPTIKIIPPRNHKEKLTPVSVNTDIKEKSIQWLNESSRRFY